MKPCEHKNLISTEVLWDYDWILYKECQDCDYKINVHTGVEFVWIKSRREYSPIYQYNSIWELVWYSRYKAKGLWLKDDINEPNNLLWGDRGGDWKSELFFKPIKDLEISHIRAIIIEWHTRNKEYLTAFINRLSSILTIAPQWINFLNDIKNESQE